MSTFYTPLNNRGTTLASAYTAGSGTLVAADGSVFGTPSPSAPVRVTATSGNTVVIFKITGRSGNNLTVDSAIEGTTDANLAQGAALENLMTAGALVDIHDAVNAAETAITGKQAGATSLTEMAAVADGKGMILVNNGTSWVGLSPGTNGYVLTANSSATNGIEYAAASGGGSPAGSDGDLQIKNGSSLGAATGVAYGSGTYLVTMTTQSGKPTNLRLVSANTNNTPTYAVVMDDVGNGGNTKHRIMKRGGYDLGSPTDVCGIEFSTQTNTKGYLKFIVGGDINGTTPVVGMSIFENGAATFGDVTPATGNALAVGAQSNAQDGSAYMQVNSYTGKKGLVIACYPYGGGLDPFSIQGGLDTADVRFAIGQTGEVKMKPLADSAVSNGSLFIGSDHSNKLCWKDGSGNVKVFATEP